MPNEFSMTRRITFAETDLAGVLYFANYYRIMEEIEHAYFRSLGFSVITEYNGATLSWPRVETSCRYYQPLRFEDEVDLKLTVIKLSNKAMTYEVKFSLKGKQVAVARATAICCTMNNNSFQSIRIPDFIRTKMNVCDG